MITCYQEIIDIMVLLLVTHRYIKSSVRHSMTLEKKIVWFDLIVVEKQTKCVYSIYSRLGGWVIIPKHMLNYGHNIN